MAQLFSVDIVSAEKSLFAGQARMVTASGSEGSLGIYPQHAPLLTTLVPGEVRVRTEEGKILSFYVSGGILEVQPHAVTVLSDTAERAADLNEAAAREAKKRAEALLADKKASVDMAQAKLELLRAVAQLRILRKRKK